MLVVHEAHTVLVDCCNKHARLTPNIMMHDTIGIGVMCRHQLGDSGMEEPTILLHIEHSLYT